jgi:transcriptional regulator with XRE-family HTH domain
MPTASDRLKEAIMVSGLSAYALARMSGASIDPILRFARGERGLSTATFDKLAAALGLDLVEEKKARRRKPQPPPPEPDGVGREAGPRSPRPARLRVTHSTADKTAELVELLATYYDADGLSLAVNADLKRRGFRDDHPARDIMLGEFQLANDRRNQTEGEVIRAILAYTAGDVDHGRGPDALPWKPGGVIVNGFLFLLDHDARRDEDDINPWVVPVADHDGLVYRLVLTNVDQLVDIDDRLPYAPPP